jgi:hypothetical protein
MIALGITIGLGCVVFVALIIAHGRATAEEMRQ